MLNAKINDLASRLCSDSMVQNLIRRLRSESFRHNIMPRRNTDIYADQRRSFLSLPSSSVSTSKLQCPGADCHMSISTQITMASAVTIATVDCNATCVRQTCVGISGGHQL